MPKTAVLSFQPTCITFDDLVGILRHDPYSNLSPLSDCFYSNSSEITPAFVWYIPVVP
jgi:hypothetical protein